MHWTVMKSAYNIIILLDDTDFDAYSTFPLLGVSGTWQLLDSGPWQLLNVSSTRRFHTLVIFLFLLDVSSTRRFTVTVYSVYI